MPPIAGPGKERNGNFGPKYAHFPPSVPAGFATHTTLSGTRFPMSTHTIRLHRVIRSTPEKVYRAFLDADALSKWLPPHGFTCKVHHADPKVGGTFRMSFTNFSTSASHAFGGKYLELVPHERIRYTDRFDDPNLPGEIQVTVTLKKVSCGTDVGIVQEGVPAVIPAESCYVGWQDSLNQLTALVEPEIPNG